MGETTKTMRVLSIDAWAGPCDPDCEACAHENDPASEDDNEDNMPAHNGGWTWNNWFDRGQAPRTLCDATEAEQIAWFVSEGYVNEKAIEGAYIDDDQHNLVLCDKKTHEPLYALEYGAEV